MLRIISGKFKGQYIRTEKKLSYRPITASLREAFFNFMNDKIRKCYFMDAFAGSGIIGIEALSRSAELVYFIEKNKIALSKIKENVKSIGGIENCFFLNMMVEKAISILEGKHSFDIIFLDPPFGYGNKKIEALIHKLIKKDLLLGDGFLAVRYEKYFGKIKIDIDHLRLIKEFKNSECYLDIYKFN